MNYSTLAGHLGSDPETRFTPSGRKVTSFRIAVRARKGGQDTTMWWRVTIWGESFDKMMPYLKKGSPVIVNGEIMPPEIYQNREGQPQVSLDITAHNISFSPFGRGKGEGNNQGGGQGAQPAYAEASAPAAEAPSFGGDMGQGAVSDDEIPF